MRRNRESNDNSGPSEGHDACNLRDTLPYEGGRLTFVHDLVLEALFSSFTYLESEIIRKSAIQIVSIGAGSTCFVLWSLEARVLQETCLCQNGT
jgi:hypothetical protein